MYEPAAPTIRVTPEHLGNDTYLVHQVQEALGAPLRVYLNSMVILGAEPTIVDTGTVANRRQWLTDVFDLVDPEDVRYVFISHDDADHTGNLAEVMELCPNATLLASWAMVERHSNVFEFPLERCRWVDHGDRLQLADRRFHFVRPPLWDSPTTRGLFDERTGIYWAVDAFATPVTPELEATVDELDPGFWRDGVTMFAYNALSPWLSLVDPARFAAHVMGVRDLGMTTVASAHSPVITDRSIDHAFEIACRLPSVPAPPVPDQSVLDAIVGEHVVAASA
jgi:flavorubredoxin